MRHPCCALLDGHSDVSLFLRKIVLNGATQSPHPFGISVFENHVFFTDWTKMGVVRTNRFNGSNPVLLYRTAKRPGHVTVSHPVLQPVGKETHFQPVTSQSEVSVSVCEYIYITSVMPYSDEPLRQTQRWLPAHLCIESPLGQWWPGLPLQVSPWLRPPGWPSDLLQWVSFDWEQTDRCHYSVNLPCSAVGCSSFLIRFL